MKFVFIILLFVFSVQIPYYEHEENFDFFKTDNLKNLYIVSEETISLIDIKGNQLFEYNNPKLGNISNIDQTSGLRTMVFYKELSTFLVLDNTLTVQSPRIKLNQFNLNYITLMCASENNHYWCFDSENNSVVRINQQINIVSNGVDLNQLLSQIVDPTEMIERHGKVYVNDPKNGIHVCDVYGNYEMTLDIKNAQDIEVKNDFLYYLIDDKIFKMNLKLNISESVFKSEKNISGFDVQVGKIYYKVGHDIFEKNFE